jgi:N-dimethylarginine dimethylaminohydrolase
MSFDFRSYNSAVQDLLARDAWRRLGEEERLEELVEKVREHHRELADEGALPALVFVQVTGRVTDREALLSQLREHDRLSEPAEGEDHDDSGLLHDALLTPVRVRAG